MKIITGLTEILMLNWLTDFCDPNDQKKRDEYIILDEEIKNSLPRRSKVFGNTFQWRFVSNRNQSVDLRCGLYERVFLGDVYENTFITYDSVSIQLYYNGVTIYIID